MQQQGGALNLSSPTVVQRLLDRYGLRPSRRLGQNFLVDQGVLGAIVSAVRPQNGEGFLEIGTGLGVLTVALAQAGARVVTIEKDRGLLGPLSEILAGWPLVQLVSADALELDWEELLGGTAAWRVVANLPYSVTSPLLLKLLAADFPELTLMVQREVGERLLAPPGDPRRGRITLRVEQAGEVEILRRLAPGSFWPRPQVESVVLRFRRRPRELGVDLGKLWPVVQAAFGERRKTLRRALADGLDLPVAAVEAALNRADLAPERRGETLSLEEYARLTRELVGHPKGE